MVNTLIFHIKSHIMSKHYKILSFIILLLCILNACKPDPCENAELYDNCNAPNNLLLQSYQQANGAVTLSWNAVAGAESYILEYEAPNSTPIELTTTSTSLSFNIAPIDSLHRFTISSICKPEECCDSKRYYGPSIFIDHNGEADCELTITNLIVEEITDSSVTLSWDFIEDAAFYLIEYEDSSGNLIIIETSNNESSITIETNEDSSIDSFSVTPLCDNGLVGNGAHIIIVTIDDIDDFCANPTTDIRKAYCIRVKQSNNSYKHYFSRTHFCDDECKGGC